MMTAILTPDPAVETLRKRYDREENVRLAGFADLDVSSHLLNVVKVIEARKDNARDQGMAAQSGL